MLTRRIALGAFAAAALLLTAAAPSAKATQIVLIGAGAADGVETLAARQICSLVDEHAGHKYGCIPRTAPGSDFNIRAIEIGLMEFAFVRSERAHETVAGSGAGEDEPAAGLRSAFGLRPDGLLLVTGADVADDLVYDVVRIVFESLGVLQGAHPSFGALEPAAMVQGLAAPLHPGAARYYREQGWL
ncbi:MAG: hypothetical protein OXI57_06030 [Rhodospirillales bacterium]|nr:hypothetical protein [Rhodospirillales bacterium]